MPRGSSRHLASVGLPAELRTLNRRFSAAALIGHMRRDKKVRDGALTFVLARGIGEAFTARDVPVTGGRGVAARRGMRGLRVDPLTGRRPVCARPDSNRQGVASGGF